MGKLFEYQLFDHAKVCTYEQRMWLQNILIVRLGTTMYIYVHTLSYGSVLVCIAKQVGYAECVKCMCHEYFV